MVVGVQFAGLAGIHPHAEQYLIGRKRLRKVRRSPCSSRFDMRRRWREMGEPFYAETEVACVGRQFFPSLSCSRSCRSLLLVPYPASQLSRHASFGMAVYGSVLSLLFACFDQVVVTSSPLVALNPPLLFWCLFFFASLLQSIVCVSHPPLGRGPFAARPSPVTTHHPNSLVRGSSYLFSLRHTAADFPGHIAGQSIRCTVAASLVFFLTGG